MGDGGVACVPSQHVMERFSESSYCGGNGGLHSNSKSLQLVVERKMEIEQGEICPEKGRKDELLASSSSREEVLATRVEVRIASSVRFPDEDGGSRDRNESRKRYSRWDVSHERERESKSNSSRNAEDEFGSYSKHRYGDGQNHGKDYGKSGNRLKRHSNESETSSSRRYYGDHSDRDSSRGGGASRSRRVCEDSRSSYLDKSRGRSSAERGYRNSSSSRISSSSNKYSSRPYELSSSRGARDRHGRSPGYSDRSPIDRGRIRSPIYYDRSPVDRGRGRSPVYLDRSPVDRGRGRSPLYSNRSPVDRGRGRSPVYSDRSPVDRGRGRSPLYSNRSPVDRGRGRSPVYSDRSPVDRGRGRSPAYLDSSPVDRGRGRSPAYLDRSPIDRGRYRDHRDGNRKSGGSDRYHSRTGNQGHEERLGRKDSGGKDSHRLSSSRQSNNNSTRNEKNAEDQAQKEKYPQTSNGNCEKPSQVDGALEEMPSMEEDMDICDSPPYVVPDQLEKTNSVSMRGWFFLDHLGTEQGPSNLCDLKKLVEDGFLLSDHLIKHSESDRWVTVENAASPLVPRNTPSIVSDTVTQLVNPPEAPGNLLVDAGDPGQSESHHSRELSVSSSLGVLQPTGNSVTSESPSHLEDLHITERVEALLKGFTLVPGRELETIAEALETTLEHSEWEKGPNYEGFLRFKDGSGEFSRHQREEEFGRGFEAMTKESPSQWSGARSSAPVGKDRAYPKCDSSHWFAGRWSCKGGDWKRNDEAAAYDRLAKRKLVLNDGYPLCQMPKSGFADPRGHKKDDLHHYLHFKRLEVPSWAYCWQEEKTDSSYQTDVFSEAPSSASNGVGSTSHGMNDQTKFVKAINGDVTKNVVAGRLSQNKQLVPRVLKGSLQPVVKNNASMVVKNQGSFFRDLRARVRGNEWHNSRSNQASFLGNGKGPFVQDVSQSKTQEKSENSPTGHIRRVDDLKLHLGDWFFLDGAGHEHGPSSFFELQALVAKGIIQKNTSIFRKTDNIWVPVAAAEMAGEVVDREILPEVQGSGLPHSSDASLPQSQDACCDTKLASGSFHDLYPQFIGYTRGRLHELVMKSYKSREFAAAINEVLDPWISAKQPKKAADRHFPVNSSSWLSSISRSSTVLAHDLSHKLQKSDSEANNMEDDDAQEDFLADQKNDDSFEELCREVGFREETNTGPELVGTENWGLLNDRILARVFYYLRTDLKCLAFSAATCKSWYAAAKFYKSVCRQVDFSSSGPACTDTKFRNILSGYDKSKIKAFVLTGCTNVSAAALEEVLQSFTAIISIDIRGCSQFRELTSTYQNVRWRRNHYLRLSNGNRTPEESHYKIRSLKQTSDRIYTSSKASKGSGSHFDDSSEEKDLANHAFQQGCYKRRKLARKSSALLSRDAHMMRGWLRRKSSLLSALDYQKLEPYLASTLKDIMRENTFKFFIPKVEEIEGRMRNRYYIHRGLSAVKDDISRMCRDAMKANTRGDAGDMSRIIMLFMKLVTSLEESSKSSHERDEMVKSLKDGSVSGYSSMNSRYKKKDLAGLSERRGMNRRNINGIDVGDYASDREFRKRLSKLNKTSMDSENETSDDTDLSEEDVRRDSEDTDSDMDVGLNFRFEGESVDFKGEIYLGEDDASMSEDREWGARMTKAGLVPPVTRKYEVIDRYVVVADEEMVHRKMHVALPDDYAEKLRAQKNGAEESDMEIPEVKDYKPRKQLGDEVLEQEVYGIDPYTHNLLLDSMPEELDWPLPEKHLFIEEVLLRALNRQVRCYTGNGSAPMEYPLRPVIREIQEDAEKTGDMRITKMCQEILKAIDSRRDDNYVAYRKGLGVVCNKEGGFGDDDFVVEFLGEVYPAWKWFEKQDGIRSLQKNNKDPAPEFYNIYLERPKGDRDGYDLVVVDAMHKANYASRICHSCRPNCEAKVTAVDGQYQIGIYTVRPIGFGEEITFDYNSVTESKEEYEASVCLCGSQVCRGSYLNLTGEGAFQKVLKECHGMLDRHQLMLEAFDANFVSQEDYTDLGRAGLGTCLLSGLPDWLIAYSARLVRFINFERTKLPEEILKHNLEEKKKFFAEICLEVEKSDAEIQAEGVYNQRLQNLALTLDKVRYVMRCVFGDPKRAPPPLEKVSSEALVSFLWKGEGSLVEELLRCMAPHVESELLNDLKSKIHVHDLSDSGDPRRELRKSLLWLRDELRNLPSTYKCRHDAAADLIHMYAYTKCFFRVRDYKTVTSEPVYISPLDLGPKYADKLGSGFQEYRKTYGEGYCLGQLIYWHNQADAEPDLSLARARRGCLALPDISSFYAKSQKPSKKRVYGPRTVKSILSRMEKQPQRPWPKDEIWSFKSTPRIFGSPMLDAVMNKSALDKEMMQWLKTRSVVFQAPWDQ